MLRLRGRKMLLGVGRRGLDPPWMGIPPTTGLPPPMAGPSRAEAAEGQEEVVHLRVRRLLVPRRVLNAAGAASHVDVDEHDGLAAVDQRLGRVPERVLVAAPAGGALAVAVLAYPRQAPALWGGSPAPHGSCLSTGPPPHASSLQLLPSPGDDVPLLAPTVNPARSHGEKPNCSRPSSASCPWSPYHAAGVLVPSPRPDVPLPASHAGSRMVGKDKRFWPPLAWRPSTSSGAGLMLLAPGAGVPLPSPPHGHGCGGGVGTDQTWQPPQSYVGSAMGRDRSFSALCLSTALTPLVHGPGAGLSLRSPKESPARHRVGLDKRLQPPPRSMLRNRPQQHRSLLGSSILSCVSRANWQLGSILLKNRTFSSSGGYWKPVTFNAPDNIKANTLQVDNRLKTFKLKFMGNGHVLQNLAQDTKVFNTELFDVSKLQKLYYDLVRDLLVSNGVIVEDAVVHDTYLRDLHRKFQSENPGKTLTCITALDLMRTLVPLPQWKWSHLLNYLRDSKIMVLEWWDIELATIETMALSFGWKLDLGDDRTLYKGIAKGAEKEYPLYTLYSVIWKENDVEDCCISLGVKCASALEAELLSVYLLEQRGIELGIQDFIVSTSEGDVDKRLRDASMVKTDKDRIEDLYMLVAGLKSKFQNFFCQEEAIEKLLFPEVLSEIEDVHMWPQHVAFAYIMDTWSARLAGSPLFRVHKQGKTEPMKKFLGRRNHKNPPADGKLTLKHVYKVKVESESQVVDAVRNVILSMLPRDVEVLVNDEEKAHLVQNGLKPLLNKYQIELGRREEGNGYMVTFQSKKGSDGRKLRIICDSTVEDDMDPNKINVRLLLKKEDDPGIQNLSPECYFFFNGVAGDRLQMGENIIKPKPKSQAKSNGKSQAKSNGKGKGKPKPE